MTDEISQPDGSSALAPGEVLARLRRDAARATQARVFLAGSATSYSTRDLLDLRADHASARDAVRAEIGPQHPLLAQLRREFGLVVVGTRAGSHAEYLRRPDLGRQLDDAAAETLRGEGRPGARLQVVLGDGLSAGAVAESGVPLLRGIHARAAGLGWTTGTPVFVRRARVGVLNELGAVLQPDVIVLLIGERPGLQVAASTSAYMAYRPRPGHTDAQRNLVCNIHDAGIPVGQAVDRIVRLAQRLLAAQASGVTVKESHPVAPAQHEVDADGEDDHDDDAGDGAPVLAEPGDRDVLPVEPGDGGRDGDDGGPGG
jgi:ethanolamine ammonia-lyase small subunit